MKLGKQLGRGNFGNVFAGTLPPTMADTGSSTPTHVAVKVPAPHAQDEFDEELKIMSALVRHGGHPHIVTTLGCVRTGTNNEPPMLVLELCARGDLKAFLVAAMLDESAPIMPVRVASR